MTNRTRALTAALLLCLTVAGCGGSKPASEAAPTTSAPAPTSAAPSPTPAATPAATLDPATACTRATNLVVTATDLISEFLDHPDGSTIDRTQLSNTIADMEAVRPSMPDGLGDDLADLIAPLRLLQHAYETGTSQNINTGAYRTGGPGLIIACGEYTS